MRIIVCGGRDFTDQAALTRVLDRLRTRRTIDAVIEGNQRGADRMAGFWARKRGILNLKFDAEWDRYGKGAGPIRNQRMIDEGKPDGVVAFPGRTGTANMIDLAHKAGIPVWEPLSQKVRQPRAPAQP